MKSILKYFIYLNIYLISIFANNNIANIHGAISVNQGILNYSIPIQLPNGNKNLTPKINLIYSQNIDSTSYFGKGWNISGLSNITRCGNDENNVTLYCI